MTSGVTPKGGAESGRRDGGDGFRAPAQLHNSLESHCAVADWRPDGLTAWCSTQGIYSARSELAATFELELDQVRVLCEYMGGGFGAKIGCGETGVISTELSRRTERPVRRCCLAARRICPPGSARRPTCTSSSGATREGVLTAIEAHAVMGGWIGRLVVSGAGAGERRRRRLARTDFIANRWRLSGP